MKPSEKRHNVDNSAYNDFLVGEKTEGVKPTGVDDESTGMGEEDYLGKSNKTKIGTRKNKRVGVAGGIS